MTEMGKWLVEASDETGAMFGVAFSEKLHEEQSEFQKIEVYKSDTFGNVLLIDGLYMVTERDNFIYHEMMAHLPLFTHPKPKNVVIIGGGDCGTLLEVLKHPDVENAWQIDIDERVTRVAEQYFPELTAANNDPRAHISFEDGVKWMAEVEANSIDIIIVDSTDPIGPGEGLFRLPFYQSCHRALADGGIVVQQSESPLFHMGLLKNMIGYMGGAGFTSTRTAQFALPSYPSGWWTATLASKGGDLTALRLANERPSFETQYYNRSIHQAAFAMPSFFVDHLADS